MAWTSQTARVARPPFQPLMLHPLPPSDALIFICSLSSNSTP